jgi:hypothetical protein
LIDELTASIKKIGGFDIQEFWRHPISRSQPGAHGVTFVAARLRFVFCSICGTAMSTAPTRRHIPTTCRRLITSSRKASFAS